MGKNITIAEGAQAKNFNSVSKLRTNLIGGGTQDWVPEDEAGLYANLGIAEIDKNGTYKAVDENLDGFSEVAVQVKPKVTTLNVTQNGTYKAKKDKVDGYSEVSVEVSTGGNLITKDISENGTYNASDDNADGYSSVSVNVSGGGSLITKNITKNGTYNASDDGASGYSSVTVNVENSSGNILINGLSNATAGQRMSTKDFFTALDEQAYIAGMSYFTDEQIRAWLQTYVREGRWFPSEMLEYDNLLLIGGAGINIEDGTARLSMYVSIQGIFDDSGVVSISNITNNSCEVTTDNGTKFTRSIESIAWKGNRTTSSWMMGGWNTIKHEIDYHLIGTNEPQHFTMARGIFSVDETLPHSNTITNLTGGTIS